MILIVRKTQTLKIYCFLSPAEGQPPLIGQEEQPQEQPDLPARLSLISFAIRNITRAATAAATIIVPEFCEIKLIKSILVLLSFFLLQYRDFFLRGLLIRTDNKINYSRNNQQSRNTAKYMPTEIACKEHTELINA